MTIFVKIKPTCMWTLKPMQRIKIPQNWSIHKIFIIACFMYQSVSMYNLQTSSGSFYNATFCSAPRTKFLNVPWYWASVEGECRSECPNGYLIHRDLWWPKEACFRNPPFEVDNKLCFRNAMSPNGIRIISLLLIVRQHCVPLRERPPPKENTLHKIVFCVEQSIERQ